ncbi:serine protease snake-like [Coccinella septempunctata]|uniref:serine protease snake-like n=1 Tax=Coccinella septempunctata TaxID=41139 RepID=UPI001D096808|nr:serine protease snake-like [Coccinella septempunctata]
MTVQSTMVEGWCIFFLVISSCQIVFPQVGNSCFIRNTGTRGICKISSDCPAAEGQARNGIDPTVCGYFQLTTPIVCCEKNEFEDGEYQSPSRPLYQRPRPSNTFSSEENDNKFSNSQDNGIFFSGNKEFESVSSNVNTFQLYPEDSVVNYGNGDSIIYPNDIESNSNNNVVLRKSEAKCLNYTKPFNEVVQAIPLLTETEVVNVNVEKCNNNGVPLIVGGEPARPGEFPFMAALGFYVDNAIDWRCGGTLISERFVVTAAHCTYSRDAGSPKVVRLGEIDLTKSSGRRSRFDFNVAHIIAHPDYNYPLRYNDIALIELDRDVSFTDYIRPACLYTSTHIEQTQSVATGYGKNEFAASENINKLMKVVLHIYKNEKCAQTFGSDKRSLPRGIIQSMLCAGDIKGGHDTCQGDSGGPLLITKKSNKCKFFLVGITSFGKSCGEANTAAVYTKVSAYIDWIEAMVWP